jgi:hypothetical protein
VLPESGDEPLVSAEAGRVSLSIPRSIWYGGSEVRARFLCGRGSVRHLPDGRIRLVGQSALERLRRGRRALDSDRLPRGTYAVTDAILDCARPARAAGRFQLTAPTSRSCATAAMSHCLAASTCPSTSARTSTFEGEASGDLANTESLTWRARVNARELDLAEWAAMLPDSFRGPAGGSWLDPRRRARYGIRLTSLRVMPTSRTFGSPARRRPSLAITR